MNKVVDIKSNPIILPEVKLDKDEVNELIAHMDEAKLNMLEQEEKKSELIKLSAESKKIDFSRGVFIRELSLKYNIPLYENEIYDIDVLTGKVIPVKKGINNAKPNKT